MKVECTPKEFYELIQPPLMHISAQSVLGLPKPTHFTQTEGDRWVKWDDVSVLRQSFHAVKFEDGSVFDVRTGWRPPTS